jgi:hypothetical protein
MRALGHPALQMLGGVITLIAFTWPLLVFERPLYVFVSFYAIWMVVIGMLFVFSRAEDYPEEATAGALDLDAADEADGIDHA